MPFHVAGVTLCDIAFHTLDLRLHTLEFTLYTLHPTRSTLDTLHFTLYILHSTLHTLNFTLHSPHSTLYILRFTLHTYTYTLDFRLHTLTYTPQQRKGISLYAVHPDVPLYILGITCDISTFTVYSWQLALKALQSSLTCYILLSLHQRRESWSVRVSLFSWGSRLNMDHAQLTESHMFPWWFCGWWRSP